MIPDYLSPYRFIFIQVVTTSEEHPPLQVSLAPASEKPGPGLPGKEAGDFTLIETLLVAGEISRRLLVSLGPREKLNLEAFRRAGGSIARWLLKMEVASASLDLDSLEGLGPAGTLGALCEGLFLGAFRFDRYKSGNPKASIPVVQLVAGERAESLQSEVEQVEKICSTVNLARDWAHEPANVINPLILAERAQALAAQSGLKCTILDDGQLENIKAGAILAVGRGSQTPSRLIILEYPGTGTAGAEKPVAIVGKALTFDTGGYSIKTVEGVQGMKYDKCGGIAVIATLVAAALIGLKMPLVGVVGAAENMISGKAYRPDDILTSLSGKTIEVISTDAEGRLVLADSLTYVQNQYQPQSIIDLATLTGGVVIALGRVRAGLMSNDDTLADDLLAAGDRTYEKIWRLPLDEEYFKSIKGDDADLKNLGGREGTTILGGTFLKQFVPDLVPWAHLDIAGMANTPRELPYCPKGATGFGIRLLLDYLEHI